MRSLKDRHSPRRTSTTVPQSAKNPARSSSVALQGRFLQKMVRLPWAALASTLAAEPSACLAFLGVAAASVSALRFLPAGSAAGMQSEVRCGANFRPAEQL